jgi:NADPH:quinone reductase-like Zn-dependent oxidoreductase
MSSDGVSQTDILGFTSYRKPPSYVPSASVLVQVWCVGLDSVDTLLLRTASVGFVPGRSFVGRALEVGWDVREDVCRRGEWVIGLLDTRKSGALQEFVVIDRHRLHRVPHPGSNGGFSVEEMALVPLCGVVAYRAVSALQAGGDMRVLVLGGEDGAGWMAAEMLKKRGWSVFLRAEPGAVYDAVIDTVGGKDVWTAASERLLVQGRLSQFVTTKGDYPSRAIPTAGDLFRGGLRSFRQVRYMWVCGDIDFSGEDVGNSLGRVIQERIRPVVSKVLMFERADRELGRLSHCAVVRIAD